MSTSTSNTHISTGLLGESLACRYLAEQGHEVVERNYRKPWGEIDVVTKEGRILHFVEVKTVSRESNGGGSGIDPADNIHEMKMKRFMRAVESYLGERNIGLDEDWQVDAVLITVDRQGMKAQVTWLPCVG